jgi:hypothetical protein
MVRCAMVSNRSGGSPGLPSERGSTLALAAAGGILAALGACRPAATSPTSPPPMPEYPPAPEKPDGGGKKADQREADPDAAGVVRGVAGGSPDRRIAVRQRAEKNCCKGKNDCKNKSGCKTENNACAGLNDCKGKGTSCPQG